MQIVNCSASLLFVVILFFASETSATLLRQVRSTEETDETSDSVETSNESKPNVAVNETLLKNISWDDINENFNKILSEDEIVVKWNSMEQKLKSGIRSILRTIFPKIVSMASDAKVSGNCSAGILKWIVSLRHLKSWAIKMLDASGKPPSGIFEGTVSMLGNYDECTKVKVFDDDDDDEEEDEEAHRQEEKKLKEFFRGKFCVAEFKPWLPKKPSFYGINSRIKNLQREADDTIYKDFTELALFFHFIKFRLDLCVPSTCSREDMQKVVTLMTKNIELRARILRCEVVPDSTPPLSSFQLLAVLFFSCLIIITIASTMTTVIMTMISPAHQLFKHQFSSFINLFSLIKSWKNFNDVPNFSLHQKPVPLYGIRALIILWIIVVHTAMIVNFQFFREMQNIKEIALRWSMQVITNSSLQFESFILFSAFTLSYYNVGKSSNQVLKYLVKKYLRLTILIMFVAALLVLFPFVLPHGPLTNDFISHQIEKCQENGIWNLFYIQNFFTPQNMCLSHTWIFCVEMQLTLIFIPLIIIVNKNQEKLNAFFWAGILFLTLISFFLNCFVVFKNELPPTLLWTLPDPEQRDFYFQMHYYKPWTHLSVFSIGFIFGLLSRDNKILNKMSKLNGRQISHSAFSVASLVTIFALIFGCHDWVIGDLPSPLVSALFDASHRLLWSLATGWLIYLVISMNEKSQRNLFAKFLSKPLFVWIGKLSLMSFCLHPLVQLMLLSTQQQHLFSGPLLMGYIIIGNVVVTFLISLIATLLVEIPICINLLKCRIVGEDESMNKATEDSSATGYNKKQEPTVNLEIIKSRL